MTPDNELSQQVDDVRALLREAATPAKLGGTSA